MEGLGVVCICMLQPFSKRAYLMYEDSKRAYEIDYGKPISGVQGVGGADGLANLGS